MKCLVLAGGFATRLYPLTISRAKALLEYRGEPIINHVVRKIPHNIDILVNTNKRFEADFRRWARAIDRKVRILVEDVTNEKQKLGAVGSLNFWIQNVPISEDLLVIAGDNYFEFSLAEFIAEYDGKHTLVAVHDIGDKGKAKQFGVVRLHESRIVEFQEKPTHPQSSLIATACYVFPPHIFPLLREYCHQGERDHLGSFIAYLVGTDEVHAHTFTEPWVDIGTAEDLA